MDSGGNSGSMQSSSGGDDEYDSRADHDSISVFLNNNHHHVVVGGGPMSNPPPPPPPPQPHHLNNQQSMFDPLPNYFTNNSNSLLNLDLLNWSKNIRSDHTNPADLGAFMVSSSSPTHQFFSTQPPPQSRPSFQIPQVQPSSGSALNDQTNNNNTSAGAGGVNVVRNPKKRSRASRRAPTTVLTTDTTNFRAMVQEFTGIPAPPFTSSSSPFPIRSRFDLFGNSNSSTFRSATSTHFESSPSYLLRPFAQKIQHPHPSTCSSSSSSSSMAADAIVSTTNTNNVNSDLGVLNPLLNFHPLFHSSSSSSTKFPFSNYMKAHHQLEIPVSDHNLKMGVFEEDFGLGPVSGQNNWVGGGGEDDEDDRNRLLRSINGNYTVSNSASDQNNVATTTTTTTRSHEGMMESWICSSD